MADNDLKQVTYGIEFDVDTNGLNQVEEKTGIVDTAIEKLNSIFEKFQGNIKGTGEAAKTMSDVLGKVDESGIDKYNQALDWADRKLDIVGTQYSLASQKARDLFQESNRVAEMFGNQSDQAMKVKEQLANAQMKELNLEQAVEKAGLQFQKQQELVDKVNSGLNKTIEEENGVANSANKATKEFNVMESTSSRIKSILGAFGIIGITQSIVNGAKTIGGATVDYQQKLAKVHATLGDVTTNDLKSLGNAALGLSSKYGISVSEVLEGENELASHGLNAKQILDTIQPSMLLSVAGNIKMADSTIAISSAVRNFNLDMKDANHVADVYTATVNKTASSMPDLAEAFKNVAPIAGQVGMSIENVAAGLGLMADKGIKGGTAGTDLKIMFERLINPVGKSKELLDQIGFKTMDPVTHKMKDLGTIVQDLNKAFSSHGISNELAKEAALSTIFGKEASPGIAALFGADDKIKPLTKELANSNGEAGKVANTINNTVNGAFNKLKQTITNTFIADIDKTNLGNSLKNFFNSVAKYAPQFSEDLSFVLNTSMKVAKGIKNNFGNIAPIIAGITGAFLAMKAVTGANNLLAAFGGTNLAGFKNFLSMAGGIALIAKGFEELKSGNTNLGALLIGTGAGLAAIEKVGLMKSGVIGLVAAGFVELKEGNTNLAGLLFGVAGALGALNIALTLTDTLSAPILIAIGAIGLAIMLIVTHLNTLQSAWSATWQGMKSIAESVINFIIGKINDFINTLNTPMKLINQITGTKLPTIPTIGYQHFAESSNGKSSGSKKLKAMQAMATGGIAQGGLTLVGEKGPELLELPQGAKVTPNNQLNQALNQKTAQNFSSITDDYSKQVKQMQPLFDTYGQNLNANLSAGITNTKQNVSSSVSNTMSNAGNLLNNFSKNSYNYGTGIVNEISQGVTDSTNNLTTTVTTLTNKVIDTFKQGFGIHSPSRVMYKIGDYLMQGLVNGMTSKDMESFVSNWVGSMSGAASGAVSGNMSGWISAAMALTGVPSNWFGALSSIIQHESGGDPNSINLWDSNAKAGHPSKGLMQLIDENMSQYHLPGMTNIYDPVSNIAAGIKYIEARYGNIFNVPGIRSIASGGNYVGYATGTNSATSGLHLTGENGPELVNFRGGEQVKTASETRNIFQRTYSTNANNSTRSIKVEAPQISISITESKDAKSTAQEVKNVIEEYFKNIGIVTSIKTS